MGFCSGGFSARAPTDPLATPFAYNFFGNVKLVSRPAHQFARDAGQGGSALPLNRAIGGISCLAIKKPPGRTRAAWNTSWLANTLFGF